LGASKLSSIKIEIKLQFKSKHEINVPNDGLYMKEEVAKEVFDYE